jgi:diguanylate cyclase (GGDEF)-like protein
MKILVLAADAKERGILENALEKSKHDVFTAAGLEEALKLAESVRPRLAIVDDGIPSEHRAEFVTRLRAPGHAPIYLLSLTSSSDNPMDADDTMRKPYTVTELVARISLAQRFLALGDSLNEAREQIENMALYDPLTGLMNHGAFFRTAQGELERARRAAAPLSVIWLDLDNFKDLNTAYGMTAGDEALKAVAATIRERSRPYDCIGRWAGDEFLVALPGVIGEDAEKIAERIIKGVLSSEILYDNQPLPLGISAGVASVIQIHTSTEIQALIEKAREAGARAKEKGGDQVLLTFA